MRGLLRINSTMLPTSRARVISSWVFINAFRQLPAKRNRGYRITAATSPGARGPRPRGDVCASTPFVQRDCEPRLVANNPLNKPLSPLTCNALISAHAEQIISTLSAALSPALARAWADQEGSLGAARVRLTAHGL